MTSLPTGTPGPPVSLEWSDVSGPDLAPESLYAILRLRNQVFVVEQECAYEDIDGRDLLPDTRHLTAVLDHAPVAYARLLGPRPDLVRIGRVIVSSSVRGQRLGHQLMTRALAACEAHWPGVPLGLSAQAHLERFYAGHGFVAVGEPYDEDGIPHVDMRHRPA
ncbi:putative acyltransferase with acyl-CoA N-acyltransferase domain [metagenome]|uniref:Putative acyltransferase with acyl-CoA N-acyltransferase domain n=1 Tax=metagenome TaxID=256318 RepID=A0A2P2BXM1_9ZZZZ